MTRSDTTGTVLARFRFHIHQLDAGHLSSSPPLQTATRGLLGTYVLI